MEKGGLAALSAAIMILSFASAASVEVFDQEHANADSYEAYHNIELHQPLGQSFKPAFGALDFVDLWLLDIGSREDGDGSSIKLTLRSGGLDGEAIAASELAVIPDGFDGVVRFAFDGRIQLEKDETYCLELTHVVGEPAAVRNYGDLFAGYDRGSLYLKGRETERSDMWFRTGVTIDSIPFREVTQEGFEWAGVTPLPFEVWESSDLVEWTFVERIVSESNQYEFFRPMEMTGFRFYQIRFRRD